MLPGRKLVTSSHLLLIVIVTMSIVGPSITLQLCGKELADALAIVCLETGYNSPLFLQIITNQSGSERRHTRDVRIRRTRGINSGVVGIVEECCRMSCEFSTMELYCRPKPSTMISETIQIQKRSDPPTEALLTEHYSHSNSREDSDGTRHEKRRLFGCTEDAVIQKKNRSFHSAPTVNAKRRLDSNKELQIGVDRPFFFGRTLVSPNARKSPFH